MKPLVFLIGYRGSGKTTLARLLAERLGWQWLDADAVLEERAGKSIRRIFMDFGELAFRDGETAVLAELCLLHNHVIATGGGVVLRAENRERLRVAGHSVWLKADAETLWQRMLLDPATAERRPDLTLGGREEVETLLKVREPLYREAADLTVETSRQTPAQIAEALAGLLQQL